MNRFFTACLIASQVISFLFFGKNLSAQVQLSGIVNHYAAVTAIENECMSRLTVNDTNGFEVGMSVLLIQMQGATIDESNSSDFGNILAMNGAGSYEKNSIDSIAGNDIFLEKQLVHDYQITGKVQLVTIPSFQQIEIVDTLLAKKWDGTTGGIIALEAQNELTLNANIDASGAGFRGGNVVTVLPNNCSWLFASNNFSYELDNWRGAPKGEGIALPIVGAEAGKGAQANGGGGGNDHNSGGGGGSNITFAGAGGNNDEPTTFGCDGFHPGVGGKEISEFSERLFLGGGGGAGHSNNENATAGGVGGGIIFIQANAIQSNGFKIISNGQTPPDGGGDGAGGGGAGGTLLLETNNLADALNVELFGGDGGLVDNGNAERCHGPGGGGSGGRILTNQINNPLLINDLNGGEAGWSINSASCADGKNEAQDGAIGVAELLENIPQGEPNYLVNGPPIAVFITNILQNELEVTNQSIGAESFLWNFGDNNISTDTNPSHTYSFEGIFTIELIVTNDCGSDTATFDIEVTLPQPPQAHFSIDQNIGCAPLTVQYEDLSTGMVESRMWTFPGGLPSNSTEANPVIIYEFPRVFNAQLEVTNAAGSTLLNFEDTIEVIPPPLADFSVTGDNGNIQFENLSANATSYLWDFGDGSPTSSEANPAHQFSESGVYEVTLTASNDFCEHVVIISINVTVTSLENILGDEKVSVFPNPFQEELVIHFEKNNTSANVDFGEKQIEIFQANGQRILSQNTKNQSFIKLNLSDIPQGVYWLSIRSEQGLVVEKIIKCH